MTSYLPWNLFRTRIQSPVTEEANDVPAQHNRTPVGCREREPQSPLFGPPLRLVSNAPAWTTTEKKVSKDELALAIVSKWIERHKNNQSSTILQVLVKLKHPTIRLYPLSPDESNTATNDARQHYGLEFQFNCSAPKCGVHIFVYLPKEHPDALPSVASPCLARLTIFDRVVDGGFGKWFKMEDTTLNLDRFERVPLPDKKISLPIAASTKVDVSRAKNESEPGPRSNRNRSFDLRSRRSAHNRAVAGSPLTVVDAERAAMANVEASKGKGDNLEGVMLVIRLTALDKDGTGLESHSDLTTYLEVVRDEKKNGEKGSDNRLWIVKVVKTEAKVGPDTYELYKIYGSTSSIDTQAPAAPLSSVPEPNAHTYPPTPKTAAVNEQDASMECSICLTDPSEVVLLPCRHLVSCKDCWLNMLKAGAGEPIPISTGDAVPVGTSDSASTTNLAPPGPVATNPNHAPQASPQGWHCIFCREPYDYMLHINMTPPTNEKDLESDNKVSHDETIAADSGMAAGSGNSGLLSGSLTPSFLRNLGFGARVSPASDLESQNGTRTNEA